MSARLPEVYDSAPQSPHEDLPDREGEPVAGGCHDGLVLVSSGDQRIRWRPGGRLDRLFESQCDKFAAQGGAGQLAVDSGYASLTYQELDRAANQLARYLSARGARCGDRIGLMLDQGADNYIAMLAVLKVGAAYVPLDPGFPAQRIQYILADAEVRLLVSVSSLLSGLPDVVALGVDVVVFDEVAGAVSRLDHARLDDAAHDGPADDLAYLIYTSGSTGTPKGVAVTHASACNFVQVAAEVYGITDADRVYQGLSVAFDFSVEEIWVPWMVGATVVPKPAGPSLLGQELHDYLSGNGVTTLCCVPTLLATLDDELPDLRVLLVSGEACPQDLVARWSRPGRRFLNVYGPTEATVTATFSVLHPDRPVTIGAPLPTYSVVILEPERDVALPFGAVGEIGIAGIGLARGYLNRDDLTERAFIPDFLQIANNPSGRIYRTGDLGRVTADGEIEYRGRIDTQVKIRGYRIELTEIESALLRVPGIAQAVVDVHRPDQGTAELVAYYSVRPGAEPPPRDRVWSRLREQLPTYMVPAYLEHLDIIPMTTSDKADRKALPGPTGPRGSATSGRYVPPSTSTEKLLAEQLSAVLGLEAVSADSDFFADLGADSLLMAQFCGRLRKLPRLDAPSIRDVYRHPTVQLLASALCRKESTAALPGARDVPTPTRAPVSVLSYVMVGVGQFFTFLAAAYTGGLILTACYQWIAATPALSTPSEPLPVLAVELYGRSVMLAGALFVIGCAVPIATKWLVIGRWRREEIPIWSLAYFRFWLVKSITRVSPLRLFVGTPLYVLYLRALGARIGRQVLVLSTNVPVCTDLLSIGDGALIPKDTMFSGYRAHSGVIQTGRVTIGREAHLGEMTVLDIETTVGDRAELGHSSALHAGQSIPPGQVWHGSPAQPTEVSYRSTASAACGRARMFGYCGVQLLVRLGVYPPLFVGAVVLVVTHVTLFGDLLAGRVRPATDATFYLEACALSSGLYFGGLLVGLLFVCTLPRLIGRLFTPGRIYPLYGFFYACLRTLARVTNRQGFTFLFGDSSYIVHYLRGLGYDLSTIEQTGSNFGMAVKQDTPYLSSVGTGTIVSDGLSMINTSFSNTSFRVSMTSIGARNFVGNNVAYPAGGRTGDNCLLATKVMVPLHGEVRTDVGLLGSPPFEIPRSVRRDDMPTHPRDAVELRERLAAKNRHNLMTMAIYLAVRWILVYIEMVIGLTALNFFAPDGAVAVMVAAVCAAVIAVIYFLCVERLVTAFRRLQPRTCSIYDSYFWWHERYWKVPAMNYISAFNGTPFKGMIWRLLGVRIGHRVFDDGCWLTERSLVTIGDDTTLGAMSTIQAHSLEDGAFKADHIVIGAGVTIGANAFVHYGVRMGDSSVLAPDSFLMKGEELSPRASWLGNPARPTVPAQKDPELEPIDPTLAELMQRVAGLTQKVNELTSASARSARRGVAVAVAAASLALLAATGMDVEFPHSKLASLSTPQAAGSWTGTTSMSSPPNPSTGLASTHPSSASFTSAVQAATGAILMLLTEVLVLGVIGYRARPPRAIPPDRGGVIHAIEESQ